MYLESETPNRDPVVHHKLDSIMHTGCSFVNHLAMEAGLEFALSTSKIFHFQSEDVVLLLMDSCILFLTTHMINRFNPGATYRE